MCVLIFKGIRIVIYMGLSCMAGYETVLYCVCLLLYLSLKCELHVSYFTSCRLGLSHM